MSGPSTRAIEAGRRMPRWSLMLLIASLALNLIVVGLVAGSIWRARAHQPVTRGVTPNLLGYAASLPLERRDLIWTATSGQRQHVAQMELGKIGAAVIEELKLGFSELNAEPYL